MAPGPWRVLAFALGNCEGGRGRKARALCSIRSHRTLHVKAESQGRLQLREEKCGEVDGAYCWEDTCPVDTMGALISICISFVIF